MILGLADGDEAVCLLFGSPAISGRPVALRPDLAIGLPLSETTSEPQGQRSLNWYTELTRAG